MRSLSQNPSLLRHPPLPHHKAPNGLQILDPRLPLLQVVDTRYQPGRFGSGFKPRPKSDAGIREIPLAPLVVEAVRRQRPPGSDPSALVFGQGRHQEP